MMKPKIIKVWAIIWKKDLEIYQEKIWQPLAIFTKKKYAEKYIIYYSLPLKNWSKELKIKQIILKVNKNNE